MTDSIMLDNIRRMDDEIEVIIGRKVFGHISEPTPTQTRITFGDGHVCLSMTEAHAYMTSLLLTAQDDPAKLPWPLCEPVPEPTHQEMVEGAMAAFRKWREDPPEKGWV